MSASERGTHWELALDLLGDCQMWATPNIPSYNAAILAYQKGAQWYRQHPNVRLVQFSSNSLAWFSLLVVVLNGV